MTRPTTAVQPLTVSTRILDDPGAVLRHTLAAHPMAFVRGGDGIVGIGEALRFEFSGPSRMRDASALWRQVVAAAVVDDPVRLRGSGLVAFGTFAFADDSAAPSVLLVPRTVLVERGDARYRIDVPDLGATAPAPQPVQEAGARFPPAAYERAAPIMAENAGRAEAREGISAFLEKRPPRWP